MEGKCPGCGRAYDISEEFLSMGGRAKCPHCLLELEFSGPGQSPARDPRRDLTKPDTRSQPSSSFMSHEEGEELDSHCPTCERQFKVDRDYLELGGKAQCPHCKVDLVFAGYAPPATTPLDDIEGAAERDEDHVSFDDDAEFGSDEGGDDLWSSSGELELPELDDLRTQRAAKAAVVAGSAEPTLTAPAPDAVSPAEENEIDFTPEVEETATLRSEAEALQDLDLFGDDQEPTAGLPDLSPPSDEEDDEEVPTQLMDRPAAEPGEPQGDEMFDDGDTYPQSALESRRQDFDDEVDREGGDAWDPFSGTSEAEGDGIDAGEQPKVIVGKLEGLPAEDHPDAETDWAGGVGAGGSLGASSDDAFPSGTRSIEFADPQPDDDTPGEEAEWDLGEGGDAGADELAFDEDEDELDLAPLPPEGGAPEESDPAEAAPGTGGLFSGLASTDDWASAAARWAESGFKADEMPSFIKSEPAEGEDGESAEDEESVPMVARPGGELLASQASEDAVEVSDTDILLLEDGDEEEDGDRVPADETERTVTAGADRAEAAVPAPVAKSRRVVSRPSFLSRFKSPFAIVIALTVMVVIGMGLVWVFSSGGEDPSGVRFSTEGLSVGVVQAPDPSEYPAKDEALEFYGRGNQLAYQRKFDDAVVEYENALRSDPGYPHPYRALGAVYAALGKSDLSTKKYKHYLRLAPGSADAEQIKQIIKAQTGK